MVDTTDSLQEKKLYFPQLDIIRFFSGFIIVIEHAYIVWDKGWGHIKFLCKQGTAQLSWIGYHFDILIRNASICVDVFFLISGFLITYILLEEKKKTGTVSLKKFFIRRILRIWPLYYSIILISLFVVKWFNLNVANPDFLASLFFINNFYTIHTSRWSLIFPHLWSICVEEHFYILWPFVIKYIPKTRLLLTFALLIMISIAYRVYAFTELPSPGFAIEIHTLSRIDVIVIGALIGYFYSERTFTINFNIYVRLLAYLLLFVPLCMFPWQASTTLLSVIVRKYYYALLVSFIMLNYNFNPDAKFKMEKSKWLHYLGKISYGIYMYQWIAILIVFTGIMGPLHITHTVTCAFLIIIFSIGLPMLSYKILEAPFLRMKKYFEIIKTAR